MEGPTPAAMVQLPKEHRERRNLRSLYGYYNWGVDRLDETTVNDLDYDWSATSVGLGATVYVLDTGLDATHEEFQDAENIFDGFDSELADNNDVHGF